MHRQSRCRAPVLLLLIATLAATECALDNRGLIGNVDGATGRIEIRQVDGGSGTGGTPIVGTGGANAGSGGAVGSGGESASGGAVGSGGAGGGGGSAIGPGGTQGLAGGGLGGRAGAGVGGRTGLGGADGICSPSTCANGCCSGGTCVANRTDQICGRAGAACAPCDACSQCSALGVCALNPTARWNVICSSATLTPTRPGNLAWDTDVLGAAALPDPFCEFVMGASALVSTDILSNTLVPMWNQSITPPGMNVTENFLIMQAGRWSVSVTDDDAGVTTNDLACSVTPRLTTADFAAGTVTFPAAQSCLSLTIRLTCAE